MTSLAGPPKMIKTLQRSNTFCTRTTVNNNKQLLSDYEGEDQDEPESEDESTYHDTSSSFSDEKLVSVERTLPNGDLYLGTFLLNVPHGRGKYLWSDGCMYEGDWKNGKACGIGRFSWPTGATYEGEFHGGRMEGWGVYIGTDGDTYKGMWVGDKMHGKGEKMYVNGDVYDGEWRDNVQHGEGKYMWRNGNVYVGEWRNGVITGNGVLTCVNGERYEGKAGVFSRLDGFENEVGNDESYDGMGDKEVTGRESVSENGVNFPRICIWEADEDAGEITCDIIDNVEVSKLYRDANWVMSNELGLVAKSPKYALSRCQSPRQCHNHVMLSPRPYWYEGVGGSGDEVKKPGQPVSKGHKNYDLMLNLQLGIRHSVGKSALKSRAIKASDFDPREKYWTRFPTEGSKHTPPHQSVDFKWKDYCPMVFRHLRDIFGIDPAEYMLAICGCDALREFSSPGKSGSCFYLTQDDRYMIKTVRKAEVKVLIRMLPKYHEHVSKYKNTLLIKFFGVHCVKPVGGQKTRFIVMGNLFHSQYRIHKRFDLKGSSYGRSIDKPEGEIDETTTLKDLDLNFVFHLQHSWFEELMRQVDRDCEFLEAEGIMDYSLLIGLHFRDDCPSNERSIPPNGTHQDKSSRQGYEMLNSENQDTHWITQGKRVRRPFIRLGANMPARAERVSRIESESIQTCNGSPPNANGVVGSKMYDVILYFGIIDILQDYDISKKLEHAYKSLQVDATSISAVDPKLYSKRFRDFMHRIFVEDDKK